MDDIVSGAATGETREQQIIQCTEVLSKGGFKLKYIIKSGMDPPENASTDGESCKLLGYRWFPKEDVLSPGLGELNFNKKKRGAKAPNLTPVITREDAEKLMRSVVITKKVVIAKSAEFYDPIGMF